MRVLQRLAHLRHDAQRLGGGEAPGLHRLAQVHAIDVFHQEKIEMLRAPKVEDADDVRMIQLRQHAALAIETLGEPRVARQLVGKEFQRHKAVQIRLTRLEDVAHAAAPDEFDDFKLRERRRHALNGWNLLRARGRQARVRHGRRAGQHAFGTEAARRLRRDGRAALGTGFWIR